MPALTCICGDTMQAMCDLGEGSVLPWFVGAALMALVMILAPGLDRVH
jgi:hypothetical protein